MKNEDYYECGSLGPFVVTISHSWMSNGIDTLKIQIDQGDWQSCEPIQMPLGTDLSEARSIAAATCRNLLEQWVDELNNRDSGEPF